MLTKLGYCVVSESKEDTKAILRFVHIECVRVVENLRPLLVISTRKMLPQRGARASRVSIRCGRSVGILKEVEVYDGDEEKSS